MATNLEDFSLMIDKKEVIYISQKLKIYNINFIQYYIMNILYGENDISQKKLVELLLTNKRSITKAVKGLVLEGYVERIIDEKDKRAYKINVTTKGETVRKIIIDLKNEWNKLSVEG